MRTAVLCAALALAPGLARAQDADLAELTRPESFISLGAGYWTDERPQWGVYDGMSQSGGHARIDARIHQREDASGTWFTFDARNLGLDDREIRIDWQRQGDLGAFLEYTRIPRDNPFTYFTGLQGIGTPTLRVPAVANPPLAETHLGTARERVGLGGFKRLGGGYGVRVTFTSEEKDGTRHWGRGGAPEFAVEPIDSTTRQLEAVLSYVGKAFQVQGGYYGSWYTSHNNLVDTALTTGASPFFLSLPLDNEAHQVFVSGGYNLSERTRATFKAAYGRATQDEQIPVGAGVATFAGAPTHLDGRIDTTTLQLGLTSRATSALSWLANLRYYESDEKTPQYRIVQPGGGCGTCVDNTPLRFATLTGRLEATYRMALGLSMIGGLEHARQDRDVPFGNLNAAGVDNQRYVPWRARLDESTLRVALRRSLAETLNGSLAYSHSKRDGSELTPTNEAQSDLINPIHIADRDRDKVRLMLDWAPLEPLTLTLGAEYAKDEYGHSAARPYGLRAGTATLLSLDAAYAVSEGWQLSAWYTFDHAKATQIGQRNANGGAAEAVKEAELEDTGHTFGAGLRGVVIPRLTVGADVLYSRNVNKYPETLTLAGAGAVYPTAGGGSAGPLPDITNRLVRFRLYAVYALARNADLRFDYVHERWKTDDWSWMFAGGAPFTYGTTTDGTVVTQAPRQVSDFFGLRYVYRFY